MVTAIVHRFSMLAIVVSILLALSGSATEQAIKEQVPANHSAILAQIAGTAEALRNYDAAPEDVRMIQVQTMRISQGARSLQERLRDRTVSDLFRRTLQQNALALDRLKAKRPEPREAIRTTTGVADDLEIKATYVSATAGTGQVPDAPVMARTKRGNTEERGFRVWYVVRGAASDPNAPLPFPQLSTPTEHQVPPGGYFMWTRRPDGTGPVGERIPVDVGKPGHPKTEVDLPVPPPSR